MSIRIMRCICKFFKSLLIELRYGCNVKFNGKINWHKTTKIHVQNRGSIHFGKNVTFLNDVHLSSIGGELHIGEGVFFNRFCVVICRSKIEIGSRCIMGPNVCIFDHDHRFSKDGILPGFNESEIIIGEGCWIGANVTILRGTHIGSNSVIGAGVVVKGNIPPNSLVTSDRKLNVVELKDDTNNLFAYKDSYESKKEIII